MISFLRKLLCRHQYYFGLNDPTSLYEYCGKCGKVTWRVTWK